MVSAIELSESIGVIVLRETGEKSNPVTRSTNLSVAEATRLSVLPIVSIIRLVDLLLGILGMTSANLLTYGGDGWITVSSSTGSSVACRDRNDSASFIETPKRPLSDFRFGMTRGYMRASISLLPGLKSSPCFIVDKVNCAA